jgi:hypothetical protein
MNELLRPLGLACLGIVLAGCGGREYTGAPRFPLSGTITYDGVAVDAGTISFLPMSGDHQRVTGGVITDGAYAIPEAKGANEGKYRVEIRWAKRTGKQYHDRELNMMVDERKEGLPPRFHKQSELTVEVSATQTTFDFGLKSK